MKPIDVSGFTRPNMISPGRPPALQWLPVEDLVIDPSYKRSRSASARRNIERIARSFSWSCFGTVVVAPSEHGKFVIIDGQHRAAAAALAGFEQVPCQIVSATRDEQATADRAINGSTAVSSRMAVHAAGLVTSDPWSVRLAEVCDRAEVELLRYPVPVGRQTAGQTMAVGAISRCLKRHGEETLITALQCITRTTNNKPGALSARVIKAICAVLAEDTRLRDSGLTLLELFDRIDVMALAKQSTLKATGKKRDSVQALTDCIRAQIKARQAMPIDSSVRAPRPAA
jgi:hypothetical protein